MITYQPVPGTQIERVRVDGKIVGEIRPTDGGFYYQPKGSKLRGDTFATAEDVRRSLEAG